MPVAGVSFEWEDLSQIPEADTAPEPDMIDRPIYMTVITSDKGPEEWQHRVYGKQFYNLYGYPNFRKHGQASIQAGQVIESGGKLTVRRVVAQDSKLANIALFARIEQIKDLQEHDENDVPIWCYADPSDPRQELIYISSYSEPIPGTSGIPAGVTIQKSLVDGARVTYYFQTYTLNGNNVDAFAKAARKSYDEAGPPPIGTDGEYPLAIFTEMGRGESNKRIRIYKDTTASSPVTYHRYYLEIKENGTILETIPFTMNPNINEKASVTGKYYNMSLQTQVFRNSTQIRARYFDDIYENFIANLEYLLGQTGLAYEDVLFGYDVYDKKISNFETDADKHLSDVFGVPLLSGDNGNFGSAPASLSPENAGNVVDVEIKNAFTGNTYDGDDIYDLDNNRIDVIFDANYHQEVKRAIEQLVNFREDIMYFRDFGTSCSNFTQMKLINTYVSKSKFCASYANYYDIYDPYSRKQITVTVTYHLAQLFISHFLNGRIRPFCGQRYGIIIPQDDFIPGSLNFSPKRTPSEDQRKTFDDLRINYLTYYDGNVLTMNTEYTSQEAYTQLSWLNNVLGVQEMIKAIRVVCPKIRYSFLDGDDLVQYKKDVQNFVIDKYSDRFLTCSIEYASNASYDSNKIIYATIKIQFRNFVQTERFKIIALPS